MIGIFAALGLIGIGLIVAVIIGCFLAHCEREVEERQESEPRTLTEAHSLYHRLLRASIDGPRE